MRNYETGSGFRNREIYESRFRVSRDLNDQHMDQHDRRNDAMPSIASDPIDISKLSDEERRRRLEFSLETALIGIRNMKLFFLIVGMWIIPDSSKNCINNSWLRFVVIWILNTITTVVIMRKALMKPIAGITPRLVSSFFGIFGRVVIMLTLFVSRIFNAKSSTWMDVILPSLFYGLYYHILRCPE